MATRRPLVLVSGELRQIGSGDTLVDGFNARYLTYPVAPHDLTPGITIYGTDDVTLAADFNNRQLYNSGGTKTLDWDIGQLFDPTAVLSVSWTTRRLYDNAGVGVLDWTGPSFLSLMVMSQLSVSLAANTTGTGFRIYAAGPASSGNQYYSPATIWEGMGWKTNATAASQPVGFRAYVKPIQGTTTPTGQWILESYINAGSYAFPLIYDTAGLLTVSSLSVGGVASIGVLSISGATTLVNLTTSSNVAVTGWLNIRSTTGYSGAPVSGKGWELFFESGETATGRGVVQVYDRTGGTFLPFRLSATYCVFDQGGINVGTDANPGAGNINCSGVYKVGANQVIGARKTGWGLPTGTFNRTALTNASTQAQFNQAIMALINDLHASGGGSHMLLST